MAELVDPLEDPEKLAIFVQEYVRHDGREDAAIIAITRADLRDPRFHPETLADRVLAKPEIQAAIRAVKAVSRPAIAATVSADTLINDMEAIFQKCLDERQYTPAIAAKKTQAELLGLLKKDITITHKHTVSDMTDAQLEQIAKRKPIDAEYTDITPSTGLSIVSKPTYP